MIRAAMYARVSSDRQEHEETIQSQLAELRAQVQKDGVVNCQEFMDEGYGRDNLVRPGLDRLRDLTAQGEFDGLYIHCPDRLASGAKLVLLVEEFQQHCVEVVFLRGSVEDTPEGKLLLHMQGAIAEYERTKIAERTRRGKLYWARQGAFMGGYVPYGYCYLSRDRRDGNRASLEIDEPQAAVVRDMFRWLVEERLSCRRIARRLTELRVPTCRGGSRWTLSTVNRMLKQEVYKGTFYYHRAEWVEPSFRKTSSSGYKQRPTGRKLRPREEWIGIPVPAIIDENTWEAAQRQLRENFLHSPRHNIRYSYLIRGLVRCARCGATCSGTSHQGRRYYQCNRTNPLSSADGLKCKAGSVRADPLEELVWQAVTDALRQPDVLKEEYQQRIAAAQAPDALDTERKGIEAGIKRIKAQQDRLTDAYLNEAIEMPQYKAKMNKLREQHKQLERQLSEVNKREHSRNRDAEALARLETFCETVSRGLDNLTFEERQQLLRLVVERVVVEDGRVRVDAVIPLGDRPRDKVTLRPQRLDTLG